MQKFLVTRKDVFIANAFQFFIIRSDGFIFWIATTKNCNLGSWVLLLFREKCLSTDNRIPKSFSLCRIHNCILLISQWLLVWPTYPGKILRCYFLFVFQFQVFIRLFQCRWNTSLTRSYFTLFMRWFIAQSFCKPLINILFSCYITYV